MDTDVPGCVSGYALTTDTEVDRLIVACLFSLLETRGRREELWDELLAILPKGMELPASWLDLLPWARGLYASLEEDRKLFALNEISSARAWMMRGALAAEPSVEELAAAGERGRRWDLEVGFLSMGAPDELVAAAHSLWAFVRTARHPRTDRDNPWFRAAERRVARARREELLPEGLGEALQRNLRRYDGVFCTEKIFTEGPLTAIGNPDARFSPWRLYRHEVRADLAAVLDSEQPLIDEWSEQLVEGVIADEVAAERPRSHPLLDGFLEAAGRDLLELGYQGTLSEINDVLNPAQRGAAAAGARTWERWRRGLEPADLEERGLRYDSDCEGLAPLDCERRRIQGFGEPVAG